MGIRRNGGEWYKEIRRKRVLAGGRRAEQTCKSFVTPNVDPLGMKGADLVLAGWPRIALCTSAAL